ncbi:MAG: L,D-transpeptidase [Thiomicrorhabdus sp.]|nr:L,D-transpeptidase [Thiomicrorhabdus sp.]
MTSSVMNPILADEVIQAERKLLSGLNAIYNFELDKALSNISELESEYPKYKLAQLLKADLLAAKTGQLNLQKEIYKKHAGSVDKLLSEAEVRWQFSKESLTNMTNFDEFVLKSAHQKHIILVSLQESRLYLFERNQTGQMVRVADYYVTIGRKGSGKQKEGDLRTPIGVYHMVDLLPDSKLPDLYGVGALPLNYPNDWDREHGKTGSGIWLHGVPSDTYIRAPRASRGCVVLNNTAMKRLLADYQLPYSTPVLIVDQKHTDSRFVDNREQLLEDIRAWVADNNHQVDWNSVSVYRYPNEENLFYITFPGLEANTLVHQFWKRDEDGDWKVVVQSKNSIQVATNK